MTPISTTHVGSLPRGSALTPLLLARDKGEAYDAAEFDRVVQAAVDEAVRLGVAEAQRPGVAGRPGRGRQDHHPV